MTDAPTASPTGTPTADQTLGDADPTIADLGEIYLDGTLVLIGCGSAKRDPEDEQDLHVASVGPDEPMTSLPGADTGPAWQARDLYTGTFFQVNREFAETVTRWTGVDDGTDTAGWAILSAKHGVVQPWKDLKHYDQRVDDLGADPTNPDHRVRNPHGLRRPDGQEIVTEMDGWATTVAYSLARWIGGHREQGAKPWQNDANTLLVLAGQKYLQPLRERGVFEYGIARMHGDPNEGFTLPVDTRFLYENIDAPSRGEIMAWLSDAVDRLDVKPATDTRQAEAGEWTGDERACERCGVSARTDRLVDVDGEVVCQDCHPEECARCGDWTHENGLGGYPLCEDCQTDRGGQRREPVEADDGTVEQSIAESVAATDGGEGDGE